MGLQTKQLANAYLNKQLKKNEVIPDTERKESALLINTLKKEINKLNGLLSPWKKGEIIPREQLDTIEGLIDFNADIIYMAMYDTGRMTGRKAATLSTMIYRQVEMKLIAKKIELTNQLMELEERTINANVIEN